MLFAHHHFFYLALSLMLMHEMDAIRCREWRIFPGLSFLNDTWGFALFMLLHVPLFYFILGGLMASPPAEILIYRLNIFFIIHLFLHLGFTFHPRNEFKDIWSWAIICGAALSSLLDLFYH